MLCAQVDSLGVLLALSVMVIEPRVWPRAEGLNVTLMCKRCGRARRVTVDSFISKRRTCGDAGNHKGALPEFVRRTVRGGGPAARFRKARSPVQCHRLACRCVAEPKRRNKQLPIPVGVKQPMFHLSSPAMSLIDAQRNPLVLQAQRRSKGSWE